MSSNRKLVICTPTFGTPDSASVSYAYHTSVMRFARDPACDIPHSWMTYSCDLTRARSRAVRLALADPEMTHLLFWDSDVGIKDPTIVPYMVSLDLDVVCFPYARKRLHWEQVEIQARDESEQAAQGRQTAGELEASACSWTLRAFGEPEGEHKNLIRVRECGMGFTMISRRCLEIMASEYAKDPFAVGDNALTDLLIAEWKTANSHWQEGEGLDGLVRAAVKAGRDSKPITFTDGADGTRAQTVALFALLFRDGDMPPEDYSFCYRWRDLGGEIWMVIPRTGDGPAVHVGSYAYGAGVTVTE